MSSFEFPAPQPNQDPNINVELPDVIDDDWCADFNLQYGRRGRRAIVNTYTALRQTKPLYKCAGPLHSKSFYEEDLGKMPTQGLFFDGEVLGARLVPMWDGYSKEYEYILHLEMKNVVDAEGVRFIADPEEEVWVPLTENGDMVVLY